MPARVIRASLIAWLLSRGLLFAFIVLGSNIAFLGKAYSGSVWETRIALERGRILPGIVTRTMTGDAWWYRRIAVEGYERRPFTPSPAATWAFFPLFPLTVRAVHVTGDFPLDGLLLSNAAFLGALLALPRVLMGNGATEEDATRAVFYAALFPTSCFLSFPLPESLFLFLTLLAFAAAQRDRWWLAGVAGALAAATRIAGVALLPALVLLAVERRTWRQVRIAWLLLIPAGTAAFMVYLYRISGNPLAFAGVQGNWGRHPSFFWTPLLDYLRHPSIAGEPWNLVLFNFAVALLALAAIIFFLVRREWSFALYQAISILLPLSSGSLQSLGRYAAVMFPMFAMLAILGRKEAVDRVVMAISISLFGWFVALLTLHVDFALA